MFIFPSLYFLILQFNIILGLFFVNGLYLEFDSPGNKKIKSTLTAEAKIHTPKVYIFEKSS